MNILSLLKKIPYWYIIAVPVLILMSGVASNQAVLIANHDKFPVMVNSRKLQEFMHPVDMDIQIVGFNLIPIRTSIVLKEDASAPNPDGMIDDIHCVMSPSSHLKALADIFDMQQYIASIGDGFIELGAWLFNFAPIAWLALIIRKFMAQ